MNAQRPDSCGTVVFNHGKESGPWGGKITKLAGVAQKCGFAVESIDYQDLPDAGPRVERLLQSEAGKAKGLILVGSSMGGYVATVASSILKPEGLFLIAPAFYIPGYPEQNPVPNARAVSVVHGWNDEVIPVEHSIRFARKFSATTRMELHLIKDDHRISAELDFVATLFERFLKQFRAPVL
jgi:alpha-beta hydrolase superfamily lysophospholipase